ncbi:MAG TPA: TolC family protein [Ignavibacteriaceae bacterium]|nr:TolC family protein [Ignavibacteriaceae bacterium]
MNRYLKILLLLLGLCSSYSYSQITLEQSREDARKNYPLIKQYNILEQLEEFNLSNASKGYFPQITVTGKASYQSEVIQIPISFPGFKLESPDKDQYSIVGEVSQVVWDGGAISAQKDILSSTSNVEKKKLEVDLYSLNDRVNQLFFSILLFDEQLKSNMILQDELQNNFNRVYAYVQNGVANQADLDAVRVEQINAKKKEIELKANKKSFVEMLSVLTGKQITESDSLVAPEVKEDNFTVNKINRPELDLFNAQKDLFQNQRSTITASNLPKISLFLQGGYGKPGLNMLKNDFSSYYIGGVRFTWNLSSLYTRSNSLDIIELNQRNVDLQSETFLFNTDIKLKQQNNEIQKIKDFLVQDSEVINLRNNIKKSAEAKYQNGTITITDLLREINLENLAVTEKAVHQIQLTLAIYNLLNTTNN